MIFFWTPATSSSLRYFAVPVWIIVLIHFVSWTGALRVPFIIGALIFLIAGFLSNMTDAREQKGNTRLEQKWLSNLADVFISALYLACRKIRLFLQLRMNLKQSLKLHCCTTGLRNIWTCPETTETWLKTKISKKVVNLKMMRHRHHGKKLVGFEKHDNKF